MAISLRNGLCVSCSGIAGWNKKKLLPTGPASSSEFSPRKAEFKGKRLVLGDIRDLHVHAQATSACIPLSMRWWEKGVVPNMVEIGSAQELVDTLLNAGDKLVVVNFYSPGCGGCRALHPKICQFAEMNPDVLFLKINYEEHRSMCASLNVHVLPFFRFYRGAQGRVCSFSCTNATIKKFKDAMAKHGTERDGTGPAKGLEESELLRLASNKELKFNLPSISLRVDDSAHDLSIALVGGGAMGAEEGMAALAL